MTDQALQLTAPGVAAIAVVRLSGDGTAGFLHKHFSKPATIGRAVHGVIRDGERVLDDAVVARLDDQTADVSLHGGAWVVHAFLELARREGFEVIDRPPLPLPAAAVEGQEIDQLIARYLPMARTELALKVLLAQKTAWATPSPLRGEGRSEGGTVPRAPALDSPGASHVPTPPDAPHPSPPPSAEKAPLYWLLHPPRVAIVGTANVGKSTLANQLFARQRVITADLPGTTRDWVGEIADVNGLAVMLVDTPGLRTSDDPLEQQAIALSKPVVDAADLVVLVLDPTQPLEPDQAGLLARFPGAIVVINKSDRGDVAVDGAIRTVATTGQGVDELRRRISAHFGCDEIDLTKPHPLPDLSS